MRYCYDTDAIIDAMCQMLADYAASRELNAMQAAMLYDAIQLAVEKFDEDLLYTDCCCYEVYDAFDDSIETDLYYY